MEVQAQVKIKVLREMEERVSVAIAAAYAADERLRAVVAANVVQRSAKLSGDQRPGARLLINRRLYCSMSHLPSSRRTRTRCTP